MDIWNDLIRFIGGTLEKTPEGYLIFFIASAIFGLMFFIADFCLYTINEKSLLKLTYKYHKKIPVFLIAYVIGSGVVGFLGVIINAINFHIMGAVSAGVGWPFILSKIVTAAEAGEKEQIGEGE